MIIFKKTNWLFTALILSLSVAFSGCATHNTTHGLPKITTPTSISVPGTTVPYEGAVVPARPGQPPDQIWVDNYGVYPNVLIVKAGTKVTWANIEGGGEYLSVVSDDGLFHGDIIASPMGFGVPGPQNFSYLFTTPGSYGYSIDPLNATDSGVVIVT